MKHVFVSSFLLLSRIFLYAQASMPLTIEDCHKLARAHYPLLKQTELILKSKEYSLDNIAKGWLPQVNINGQATYQSDVTQIPVKIPNINIENPSRDQYKIYAELSQTIFDGGMSKIQKELLQTSGELDQQKLEVELYKLKERINQLFFGILLINEQLSQVYTLQNDIESGMKKVEGSVNNGAALKSSLDVIKAELLKSHQHEIDLRAANKAYLSMLGLFINKIIDENTLLVKPRNISITSTINRPELHLYTLQKNGLDVQGKTIFANNLPKMAFFVQGGYGKPALNLLKNKFDAYYAGGIRIAWRLGGLYTEKKDRQLLDLNRQSLEIEKETFLFNTNLSLSQQSADIARLTEQIKTDIEIIALRTSIKNTAHAQLNFGTITSNDFIREVNAEDISRQNMLVHQIQLLMAQFNYRIISGN